MCFSPRMILILFEDAPATVRVFRGCLWLAGMMSNEQTKPEVSSES